MGEGGGTGGRGGRHRGWGREAQSCDALDSIWMAGWPDGFVAQV